MNPTLRKIIMVLFAVAIIATIVIYIVSGQNMTYTWYAGGTAIVLYLINRLVK